MKGFFKPRNPSKYKGNPTEIIYRSSYELKFMNYLDKRKEVLSWGSEEIIIWYRSPVDKQLHRYFIDFNITQINKDGVKETILVEVKPKKFTKPPEIPKRKTKKFLNEVMTWGINQAKWKAAESYCKDRGWTFKIFTEENLGIIT